jgi:hypothetical protein
MPDGILIAREDFSYGTSRLAVDKSGQGASSTGFSLYGFVLRRSLKKAHRLKSVPQKATSRCASIFRRNLIS